MTEAEWEACMDPRPMLDFMKDKASDRKLRLFACACCRRIMHMFTDKHVSRKTIEFAERYADGQATKSELRGHAWGKSGKEFAVVSYKAWDAAKEAAENAAGILEHAVRAADDEILKAWLIAWDIASQEHSMSKARDIAEASMPAEWVAAAKSAWSEERKCQSFAFRDIFLNPFRVVTLDPSWVTPSVLRLAQSMYDERTFDRIRALAYSLEQLGCTDREILAHCRQHSEHFKGCWVLDLLLGKT